MISQGTDSFSSNSKNTSFLDVLRDTSPYPQSAGNQPAQIVDNDDIAGLWQNLDIGSSDLFIGLESHDIINKNQDMFFENHIAYGVKGLQAEANAMLNPAWILGLDNSAVTQSMEANVDLDHFDVEMLEPSLHGQNVDYKSRDMQQAGYAPLRGTGPEDTDTCDSMLTSFRIVTVPSQAQSDTTQELETANDSPMLHFTKPLYQIPVPNPEEVPKIASKRKRIKTAISRKKPCLTPSHHTHNDDSSASKNHVSSKLTLRPEAAKTVTTNSKMSTKQPGHDCVTQDSRVDWMPAREQGNDGPKAFDSAGIVSDIKILDSERRPMSWPHRNPWRKSLDISVAVLTKRFEKLMTERGEASLSAV